MSSPRLPRLESGVSVSDLTARQDKIMVEVGDWSFFGDNADLLLALNHLSDHFAMPQTLGGDVDQPVFNRMQGRGWPKKVQFRALGRSGARRVGAPIIGGQLQVKRVAATDDTPSHYRMRFYLALNPTRLLAHQPTRRQLVEGGHHVTTVAPISLLTRPLPTNRELSLYDDNVLISVRTVAMARPELWPMWLEAYLVAVIRCLTETMISAFDVALSARLRHSHHYAVTELETYWEFQSSDPVRAIYELEPHLTSFGESSRVREYQNVASEVGEDHNSLVVRVAAATGRTIKAYAKGTERVRLEVEQVLGKIPHFGRHTTANPSDLLAMILRAAQMGADDLNLLLRHLDNTLLSDAEQQPPYTLVAAVIRAAPERRLHDQLISILVNRGAITLQPNSPFRPAVEALRKAGDVERTRRYGQTYRLAAKYRDAQNVLGGLPRPTVERERGGRN